MTPKNDPQKSTKIQKSYKELSDEKSSLNIHPKVKHFHSKMFFKFPKPKNLPKKRPQEIPNYKNHIRGSQINKSHQRDPPVTHSHSKNIFKNFKN